MAGARRCACGARDHLRMRARSAHAGGGVLPARPRPTQAPRARLRRLAAGHRHSLARHGLARRSSIDSGSSASIRKRTSGSAARRRSSSAASRIRCWRPTARVGPASVGPDGVGPDRCSGRCIARPSIIAYNNRALTPAEAPQDWDDMLAPRWHDQVLIRDPMASGTMRAIWGCIIERSLRETGDTTTGMPGCAPLDVTTKAYALNPAMLDQKLARQEGLVTLWDLPDILISQREGPPVRLRLPAERHGRHRGRRGAGAGRTARRGGAGVHRLRGEQEAQLLAARKVFACRRGGICPSIHCRTGWRGVERDDESARRWTGPCWRATARRGWATGTSTCGGRAGVERRGERLSRRRGPVKRFQGSRRGPGLAHAGARRDARAARSERQRQDDDPAAPGRLRDARRGPRARGRRGRHALAAGARGASAWCSSTTPSSRTSMSGANVAFGLESRGVRGAELGRRVAEALTLVDLAGFERRGASGSSPAASSSGWRSPARWRPSRGCCSSTSRSRTSTPRSASGRGARSASVDPARSASRPSS